ncbi:MAG: hypothetical protein AAF318_14325 [Pseudomonadota bacterium]
MAAFAQARGPAFGAPVLTADFLTLGLAAGEPFGPARLPAAIAQPIKPPLVTPLDGRAALLVRTLTGKGPPLALVLPELAAFRLPQPPQFFARQRVPLPLRRLPLRTPLPLPLLLDGLALSLTLALTLLLRGLTLSLALPLPLLLRGQALTLPFGLPLALAFLLGRLALALTLSLPLALPLLLRGLTLSLPLALPLMLGRLALALALSLPLALALLLRGLPLALPVGLALALGVLPVVLAPAELVGVHRPFALRKVHHGGCGRRPGRQTAHCPRFGGKHQRPQRCRKRGPPPSTHKALLTHTCHLATVTNRRVYPS